MKGGHYTSDEAFAYTLDFDDADKLVARESVLNSRFDLSEIELRSVALWLGDE